MYQGKCRNLSFQFSNLTVAKEGMMLKLKLQYFGHLMRKVDSLEKTLTLGGTGGRRRRGWQRMRWLDGITDSMDVSLVNSGSWWWIGRPGVLRFVGSQRVGHDWATELNWTYSCNRPPNSQLFNWGNINHQKMSKNWTWIHPSKLKQINRLATRKWHVT